LIEVIKWDKASLLNLMAKRIEYSFPELQKASPEEWWRAIFMRKFEQGRFYSFYYLIERTLYRPREIIQFYLTLNSISLLATFPQRSSARAVNL
jgi:hypothetical protein